MVGVFVTIIEGEIGLLSITIHEWVGARDIVLRVGRYVSFIIEQIKRSGKCIEAIWRPGDFTEPGQRFKSRMVQAGAVAQIDIVALPVGKVDQVVQAIADQPVASAAGQPTRLTPW